jgi:hypothetical protein
LISDQFDSLSRSLRPQTRRGTMRVLAGAPLAGLLTALLPPSDRVQARKPKGKKGKGKKGKRSGGKPGTPPQNTAGCPDCTCPPDPRMAAVETCWANGGIAVQGECDCGWFHNIRSRIACDTDVYGSPCACFATFEMTGFCGQGVLPVGGAEQDCFSSAECAPKVEEDGDGGLVLRDHACVWLSTAGKFQCWGACHTRPA